MNLLIFAFIWYMFGVVGCILGVKSDLSRGVDFKLSDLFISILISFLGFFAFFLGLCEYCSKNNLSDPTLIKGNK